MLYHINLCEARKEVDWNSQLETVDYRIIARQAFKTVTINYLPSIKNLILKISCINNISQNEKPAEWNTHWHPDVSTYKLWKAKYALYAR